MYSANEYEARLEKLGDLRKMGHVPYKGQYRKTHTAAEALSVEDASLRAAKEVFQNPTKHIRTAGRVLALRNHGGIIFCDIQDVSGQIQVAFAYHTLESFNFLKQFVDPGDFVGVAGELFITKSGTKTLFAAEGVLLTKALRPLPSKKFGIKDTELRYRKRYLDFILDEKARERLRVRSAFVRAVREWLLEKNFMEVKTRALQTHYGGASAEPFTTHHRYLNTTLNLRISNELDLKMAVAGGFERVFEFATDFRNEGVDSSHLQEFQMLEWYCAYEDYTTGIAWTKELLRHGVEKALGTTCVSVIGRDGTRGKIDFNDAIPVITFQDMMQKYAIDIFAERAVLTDIAHTVGIGGDVISVKDRGGLLDEVFKKKVRPNILNPVIITDYPSDLFPLARRKDNDPRISESYQLIIQGWEVVKGYSELVDPEQQRQAFLAQEQARSLGDKEAMTYNKEFLTAMEHGMPPISGFGMGIERIIALITGATNLKETVLFPLVAPDDTAYDTVPYALP